MYYKKYHWYQLENLPKYQEVILYTGDNYDGNINVQNIKYFKTLRATARRESVHRNNITFYVSDLIQAPIVIDIEGGGGTITYVSDTQLTIHGGKGYFLEIIGIKF